VFHFSCFRQCKNRWAAVILEIFSGCVSWLLDSETAGAKTFNISSRSTATRMGWGCCTCMYTCTFMCAPIVMCKCIITYLYVYTYIFTSAYAYHTYVCTVTYLLVYTYIFISGHVQYTYVCTVAKLMYVHVHIYAYAGKQLHTRCLT